MYEYVLLCVLNLDYLLIKLFKGFCANKWNQNGPNHKAKAIFFLITQRTPSRKSKN
jgi:hypothetical protein